MEARNTKAGDMDKVARRFRLAHWRDGFDILKSVSYHTPMSDHRIRKSISRGTPSYQLGHYEMSGEAGKRRSVFKVDVHLGEHATPEDALATWPQEVDQLRQIGRESKADKVEAKLNQLRGLID